MWLGEPVDEEEFVVWRDRTFKFYEEAFKDGRINSVEHDHKRNALLHRCNERRDAEKAERLEQGQSPLPSSTARPQIYPTPEMWPGEPDDPIAFDKWKLELSRSYEQSHTSGEISTEEYTRKCAQLLMRSNERVFAAAAQRNRERDAMENSPAPGDVQPSIEAGSSMMLQQGMPSAPQLKALGEEGEEDIEMLDQMLEEMEGMEEDLEEIERSR